MRNNLNRNEAMNTTPWLRAMVLISVLSVAACGSTGAGNTLPPLTGATPAAVTQRVDPADVHFMTAMVPHHAQAVRMALLVPERSSRPDVKLMAERMLVSQRDEIELIRQWLGDRDQPVPAADATHVRMRHGDMVHDVLMPGMLTEAELAQLEAARGVEFDRLFLTYMIRHHEGALAMVNELFAAGAGQDDFVFKFASDVNADQQMEIRRMKDILSELPAVRRP
jgi:uncharacterized protein (DUF305 family)